MQKIRYSSDSAKTDTVELPNDPALEAAVLGALLLEPNRLPDVRSLLPAPSAFYDQTNAALYGLLLQKDDAGEAVSLYTLATPARKAGIDPGYLADLTTRVGSGMEVQRHAERLADLETRRGLWIFGSELRAKASQLDSDAVAWALARLDAITGDAARFHTTRSASEVVAEALAEIEHRVQLHRNRRAVGIPSGIQGLDRITGGWRGGELVVLAGRPAMGKTAVSLAFARAAAEAGIPVCYFSLEMGDTQLITRMLVGASGVDPAGVRSGCLTADDWTSLECGAEELRPLPIAIFDEAAVSMASIRARCRAMHRRGRCGMVLIDYLQLVAPDTASRSGNREREVAEMSRAAKLLAKELDVPVVLLSQLSRKLEEREDKMPRLSDLRESGAIEQDADRVIFVYRPAAYGLPTICVDRFGSIPTGGIGFLKVAKNREGETKSAIFRHNESLTRIGDYELGPSQ